jgi:hypothetical protein
MLYEHDTTPVIGIAQVQQGLSSYVNDALFRCIIEECRIVVEVSSQCIRKFRKQECAGLDRRRADYRH